MSTTCARSRVYQAGSRKPFSHHSCCATYRMGTRPRSKGARGDTVRRRSSQCTDNRVLIVDFKTLRSPPATEAEVSPVYLRQLALYRAALARIYPGHEIRCALLWTESPLLMPISPERLAGHSP